ncbi:MAG: histidinol dehydrogenase [Saprospiraceae bacterium]|nr:histidinol dehydrogenase [Saprospiraceae bacterium]
MINIYQNPDEILCRQLTERPQPVVQDIRSKIELIIDAVRKEGDFALHRFTRDFDHVNLDHFMVTERELSLAEDHLSESLKTAILVAKENVARFHTQQKLNEKEVETADGVLCWRTSRPIEKVGLYIPGGSAPLFSTVLMLAVPAQIAGCREIVLCSPPQRDGSIHPAILFAAKITGVSKILKIGGAQAIAAMALGTESVPRVDKIFGPGNHFVTEAKVMVQQLGVAIDLPAGPSEVLIIADQSADPEFIAADMLSQAEHGIDSQVVMVTNYQPLVEQTKEALDRQLTDLPRKEIARVSIDNSLIIYFDLMEDCIEFSNRYAPEHLILSLNNPQDWIEQIHNAGSVFLGHFSPESIGDYASGTNHTLPTGGWARSYSGVSLDSFVKKITFQQLTQDGLRHLGPHVEVMAEAESLIGHKRAISIRLKSLQ